MLPSSAPTPALAVLSKLYFHLIQISPGSPKISLGSPQISLGSLQISPGSPQISLGSSQMSLGSPVKVYFENINKKIHAICKQYQPNLKLELNVSLYKIKHSLS
jgi:hypothetical protein